MYFEIKGVELEIVNKVALEDNLSLDGALKKLLFLGRDSIKNEDIDSESKTQALEIVLERIKTILRLNEDLVSEILACPSEIRKVL